MTYNLNIVSRFLILIGVFGSLASCVKEPEDTIVSDDFDRAAMLEDITSGYILPAYATYLSEIESFETSLSTFENAPNDTHLEQLRNDYVAALKGWQTVAFLDFGPANNIALIGQSNTYPVDTSLILTNISQGGYSLAAGNQYVAKGWQTIDYLLFKEDDLAQNVSYLSSDPAIISYLEDVVEDLKVNTTYVVDAWSTYKTEFVENNLSNASGSSVSELMNAIIQHYEVHTRKGKIGVPVGVFNGFSQQPMPGHVEGLYSADELIFAQHAMTYFKRFLNGMNYSGTSDNLGLLDYADYVGATIDNSNLSQVINSQMDIIVNISETNGTAWSEMVQQDPISSSEIYTEYQKLVPYLKVDLTSALGVIVTYQDNDGD